MKSNAGFIVTLNVSETFLDGGIHSLILVSRRKNISPRNVLHNLTYGMISTTE